MPNKTWSDKDVATLCKLWREGVTTKNIAIAVNRNPETVRQYVYNHKKRLGLIGRSQEETNVYRAETEFDREYRGPVPFGHWAITKPWRKVS